MFLDVLFIFFIFISRARECICLRIVRVVVPAQVARGQSALLRCEFELDGDALYSVKWYRDNVEFYRYVPRLAPPQHSYKLEGIRVDHQRSDARRVQLRAVTLQSSGDYRCEVSAEAPSFASAHGDGRMEVVYVAKDDPRISGAESAVAGGSGGALQLNCTSGRSFPASDLTWYINNEKVTDPALLVPYPPQTHAHGLLSASLGVRVRLAAGSEARLRCVARLAITGLDDTREALVLVRSSSNVLFCSRYLSIMAFIALGVFHLLRGEMLKANI